MGRALGVGGRQEAGPTAPPLPGGSALAAGMPHPRVWRWCEGSEMSPLQKRVTDEQSADGGGRCTDEARGGMRAGPGRRRGVRRGRVLVFRAAGSLARGRSW